MRQQPINEFQIESREFEILPMKECQIRGARKTPKGPKRRRQWRSSRPKSRRGRHTLATFNGAASHKMELAKLRSC